MWIVFRVSFYTFSFYIECWKHRVLTDKWFPKYWCDNIYYRWNPLQMFVIAKNVLFEFHLSTCLLS